MDKFVDKFSLSDFDFSCKRVKYRGKVLRKVELSCLIGMIKPLSDYHLHPDSYLYADYASALKSLLS